MRSRLSAAPSMTRSLVFIGFCAVTTGSADQAGGRAWYENIRHWLPQLALDPRIEAGLRVERGLPFGLMRPWMDEVAPKTVPSSPFWVRRLSLDGR